jgi:hypothetical protein
MTWLFVWKVVLAAAAISVCVHVAAVAVNATRDAFTAWKAPRAEVGD